MVSPYVLVILNILDKSLDITKDFLNVDKTFKRRILKAIDKYFEYEKKIQDEKIILNNSIQINDFKQVMKSNARIRFFYEMLCYYDKKRKEYEEKANAR